MKKLSVLLIVTAFAFAFAVTSAFAAGEVKREPYNGITIFSTMPLTVDDGSIVMADREAGSLWVERNYVEGSAAGGLRESRELNNGITYFEPEHRGMVKDSGKVLDNGVTIFDSESLPAFD